MICYISIVVCGGEISFPWSEGFQMHGWFGLSKEEQKKRACVLWVLNGPIWSDTIDCTTLFTTTTSTTGFWESIIQLLYECVPEVPECRRRWCLLLLLLLLLPAYYIVMNENELLTSADDYMVHYVPDTDSFFAFSSFWPFFGWGGGKAFAAFRFFH